MTTTIVTPMAHSHSRLQVFSSCPLSYKLQYLDKVPTESSDAMEIGAAAHEFFDRWVKLRISQPNFPPEGLDWQRLAADCFQKEARNQDNFKDYLEICKTFAEAYKPDPAYPFVQAELQIAFDRKWKVCDWNDPSVMFRAKVDRIEAPDGSKDVKKIRITDYKTGFSGQMNSFQLDVYAFIASLIFPHLEQVEIQFYYVKSGFKQVKLLNVEDMGVTKIQLEALMERIESEQKWKPKPGLRCLNCSVAAHCTAKPSNLVAIDSPATAKDLGTEIAMLEAQAKAKKKALSAWCRQQGAVDAGGLKYDHYPQESFVVDMGPFLSACVACQVDPAEVLNPDKRAIQKAMKKSPGFQEAITAYIGIDVSTRFYGKKADGDDE